MFNPYNNHVCFLMQIYVKNEYTAYIHRRYFLRFIRRRVDEIVFYTFVDTL